MSEESDERFHGDLPSWHKYSIGAQNALIAYSIEDPEVTLMVQLMIGEVALMAFCIKVTQMLFPELRERGDELAGKLSELGEAQDFFERNARGPSDEGATPNA